MAKFGISLGLVLYFAFSLGFVFLKYWNWFVLPVFSELPEIDFHQAVGLQMFLILFSVSVSRKMKEEYYKEDELTHTIIQIITPWSLLLIGWIVYLFI